MSNAFNYYGQQNNGTSIGAVGGGAPPVQIPQNNGAFGTNLVPPGGSGYGPSNVAAASANGGGGPPYNFTPYTPQNAGNNPANAGQPGYVPQQGVTGFRTDPSAKGYMPKTYGPEGDQTKVADYTSQYGNYGTNINQPQAAQKLYEKSSIANDVNYGDYQQFGTIAQQYGGAGQNVLNDPRAAQALATQGQLAAGKSADQTAAMSNLQNAAAGNGPSAAQAQLTAGSEAAQRQALAQAASTRGNFGLGNAQKNAMAAGAAGAQTSANQAAQLRAQEMQTAQQQYSQAAQAQYTGQTQAAQGYQQGAAGAQNQALNYYESQQQAYQHQSDIAAQLATNQVANDYGLAGTQLQTQTQSQIANNQQNAQMAGAGMAAGGALLAALL